jgi:hypothetical protein
VWRSVTGRFGRVKAGVGSVTGRVWWKRPDAEAVYKDDMHSYATMETGIDPTASGAPALASEIAQADQGPATATYVCVTSLR